MNVGWLADRLRNVALFLPFGAVLAPMGLRALPAIGLGAALSVVVETFQLRVPGRYPALADVVANVLGTALGFTLGRGSRRWLPFAGIRRAALVAGTALGSTVLVLLPGLLLRPDLIEPPHHGQRVPRLGSLARYDGQVDWAAIDGIEITPGSSFPAADARALAGAVGMKVGGKRRLVIPPSRAYGSNSVGSIPAHSTLVFEIQLLSVAG